MVRDAAQEAINAIFDTEKPVTSIPTQPVPTANHAPSYTAPPAPCNAARYEGFGSSNSSGNYQGGLTGISGPSSFEEDRSILSYASAAPNGAYNASSGISNKLPGFGNTPSNPAHGFDGSKGIEVVKQVGAKAASIINAGLALPRIVSGYGCHRIVFCRSFTIEGWGR